MNRRLLLSWLWSLLCVSVPISFGRNDYIHRIGIQKKWNLPRRHVTTNEKESIATFISLLPRGGQRNYDYYDEANKDPYGSEQDNYYGDQKSDGYPPPDDRYYEERYDDRYDDYRGGLDVSMGQIEKSWCKCSLCMALSRKKDRFLFFLLLL